MSVHNTSAKQTQDVQSKSLEISDNDGLLNLNDAQKYIHWLDESVQRVIQLSSQIEIPQYAKDLLEVLIESLGINYLDVVLDNALERSSSEKQSPEMQSVLRQVLHSAQQLYNLITTAANRQLIGHLAADSPTVQKEMSLVLKHYGSTVEGKMNVLRNILISIENSQGRDSSTRSGKKKWDKLARW
ncbi:exocyst complex component Sec10-like protein [Lipomyces oligophaga]|uniref:exocyst complex component Sec10-like protein n=1 Tax=Lipomyces oligophaga TaxID=45792 RepID=UPI0034CF2692